jgi:hypothetical protein
VSHRASLGAGLGQDLAQYVKFFAPQLVEHRKHPMPSTNHSAFRVKIASVVDAFPLPPIPPMAAQGLDGMTHVVRVYFAGSTHMLEFLKPLGLSAYKVGVTGCRDPLERIGDLRRNCYAQLYKRPKDDSDAGILLNNAREWFLAPVSTADVGLSSLPRHITIAEGHIVLRVPRSITIAAVDKAVHVLLRPRALRDFFCSPDGRGRLVAAGHDPNRWFHTIYQLVEMQPRISAAEELYLVRPKRELTALIQGLAAILRAWYDVGGSGCRS